MTYQEYKKIARLLKQVYKELEEEAKEAGIGLLTDEYEEMIARARELTLEKMGYSLEEYLAHKSKTADELAKTKNKVKNIKKELGVIDDIKAELAEVKERKIPTEKEIEEISSKIAEKIAKKYIKPPKVKVVNKVVEKIKQPIYKTEKIVEKVEYNEKPLLETISGLSKRIDELNIPEPVDYTKIKDLWQSDFGEMFEYNINTLGMPNFRKLAMGLEDRIAKLEGPSSGTVDAAGSDTQIQFNKSGILGADSTLVYDHTNARVGIGVSDPDTKLEVSDTSAQLKISYPATANQATFGVDNSGNLTILPSGARLAVNVAAGDYGFEVESPDNNAFGVYSTGTNVRGMDVYTQDGQTALYLYNEDGGVVDPYTSLYMTVTSPPGAGLLSYANYGEISYDPADTWGFGGVNFVFATDAPLTVFTDNGYTPNLVVDNANDRVGIGTASPSATLDVVASSNNIGIEINGSGSGDALQITHAGSGIKLNISNGGSGDFVVVDTSKFVIDNDGNIGIGTAIPSFNIEFEGTADKTIGMGRDDNVSGNDLTISSGGGASGQSNKGAGNLILKTGVSTGRPDTILAGNIEFWTAGNGVSGTADNDAIRRAMISSFGGFLFGSPAASGAGTGYLSAGIMAGIDVSYGGSPASLIVGAEQDKTTRTDSTDKVGRIGYAPYNIAHRPVAVFHAKSSSSKNETYFGGGTSVLTASTDLYFYTASAVGTQTGTEAMRITNNQRVGINEVSPDTELHVGGQMKDEKAVGATFISSATGANLYVVDSTSQAAGVGGAIGFNAAYSGTTQTNGAAIKMMKTNGTDGNWSYDLAFGTRANGGSLTEAMRIKDTGDLLMKFDTYWEGDGSGLPYGDMYTNTTIVVSISASSTPTEVKDATNDGWTVGELNSVTFPTGGDEHYLTVTRAGRYLINWSVSMAQNSPSATIETEQGIMVNGTAKNAGRAHRTVSNSTDRGNSGGCAILDLAANDQVSLFVSNETNTTDIDVEHANLSVVMVGGT